jgi:aryl-alcohol dehydrogenase-like predicted oxidoreductase
MDDNPKSPGDRGMRGRLDDGVAGTLAIGGFKVRRLGYGAARLSTVGGVTDVAPPRDQAVAAVRRAVERGVNFIDTAAYYGLGKSEEIVAEALHPYPADLMIATKAGLGMHEPAIGDYDAIPRDGRPESIRAECEASLKRLRREAIDLYSYHYHDPKVPYEETLGAFADLQRAGKVRHIGVSNVTLEQLRTAQAICEVVAVQLRYNVGDREYEPMLRICEQEGMAFMPWFPLMTQGSPAQTALDEVAAAHGATRHQAALAWLLQHSPCTVPIPGTSKAAHVDENVDAAWLRLSADEMARLDAAAPPP